MTQEEAIGALVAARLVLDFNGVDAPEYTEAINMAISGLRPVSREQVEKFKEYFDELYGKGLEVYGWHLNGDPEPFDNFYEGACEYAGL